MKTKLPTAAITDEFCPDLEKSLQAMAAIGMTGAELRVVYGKNILDLSDSEVESATALVKAKGLQVISLSSPLLKCVLPDAPPVDGRFQHDIFGSKHTFEDQPRLSARAFQVAHKTGARIIRVFSYWRTETPEKNLDRIAAALADLAKKAAKEDLIIGLENEHACNIGTATETARVLAAVNHPNLRVIWDPANCEVAGETAYPGGYRILDPKRIVHVHAKDCHMEGHTPVWGPLGTRTLDWKGQIAALLADGYRGYVSLETHWPGPGGDKFQASVICGWNLQGLLTA